MKKKEKKMQNFFIKKNESINLFSMKKKGGALLEILTRRNYFFPDV